MKKSNKLIILVLVIFMILPYVFAEPAPASDFEYDLASDNVSVVITKYKGTAKNVEIPAEIEGLPVSELRSTFARNKTIESVIMPDTVKKLTHRLDYYVREVNENEYDYYGGVFQECTSLKSVILSKNIESTGVCSFDGCTSLKSIEIPEKVKDIAPVCFRDCTVLENITLPQGLETIHDKAFKNCKSLKNIKIPDTVKRLGTYFTTQKDDINVFAGSGITEIELPDSVTEIGDGMFRDCKSLRSVKFGNKVFHIGKNAFYGCEALDKIEFPSSLKYINNAAFSKCTVLKEIVIPEDIGKIYICDDSFPDALPLALKARLRNIGEEWSGYKGWNDSGR